MVRWSYSDYGVVVMKTSKVVNCIVNRDNCMCAIVTILTQVERQLSLSFTCWIFIVLLLQETQNG